jgi:hypothetical protein
MVLKAFSLGLPYGGVKGDTGDSGATRVITGTGETPVPLELGLTSPRLQPRLDAAGHGDHLLQPPAALGALGFLQVHGLRRTGEAPQERLEGVFQAGFLQLQPLVHQGEEELEF